jgi:tetratricopeptide (TPR) repeat protein
LRAQLALRDGDTARAEHELQRALQSLHAAEQPDLTGAISVLREMAKLARARGDFEAAERFARVALPLAVRRRGERGLIALYVRHDLALALEPLGRAPEALELLDGVDRGLSTNVGPDDPRTIIAEATRALTRGRVHGRTDLSNELIRLVEQEPRLVARGGLHGAIALGVIADLALDLGELHVAAEFAEAEVRCLTELESANRLDVALAHVGAAEIWCELLDSARASEHARAALAICEAPGEML